MLPTRIPRRGGVRIRPLTVFVLASAVAISACRSPEPAEPAATNTVAPTTTATVAAPTTTITAPTTTTEPTSTTTEPPLPDQTIPIPSHASPTIDGVIADGEWDGATVTSMTDGSTLQWMHSGETLYVALQGHSLGAVNVALATGSELWILHSSAALGSVRYSEDDETWTLVHDFTWCCRSTTDDTARLALLEDEGWQATIGFTGDPGTVEYEVTLSWIDAATAVSYQTEGAEPAFWPTELTAEATADLIGPFPDETPFHLGEWYQLAPADS